MEREISSWYTMSSLLRQQMMICIETTVWVCVAATTGKSTVVLIFFPILTYKLTLENNTELKIRR